MEETRRKTYYRADRREQYKRRALEADLAKLAVALVAELVVFFLWLDGPARERYEILAHIAIPILIVLPIINYRYLIVVPFIAFLPDLARAFDIDISHSVAILPLVFVAGFVPFIRRPKTALVAGYAAFAIWASHLIVDARKYAVIGSVNGYPWSDLVLYTVLLTVVGFLLMQALRFGTGYFKGASYEPRNTLNDLPQLSSASPTAFNPADDNGPNPSLRPRRSRSIEVTAPEETTKESGVAKARDPSKTDQTMQFDFDGFVVGDVTSKKALRSKIRDKKGL